MENRGLDDQRRSLGAMATLIVAMREPAQARSCEPEAWRLATGGSNWKSAMLMGNRPFGGWGGAGNWKIAGLMTTCPAPTDTLTPLGGR